MKLKQKLTTILDATEYLLYLVTVAGAVTLVGHAVLTAIKDGGWYPLVLILTAIALLCLNVGLRLVDGHTNRQAGRQ